MDLSPATLRNHTVTLRLRNHTTTFRPPSSAIAGQQLYDPPQLTLRDDYILILHIYAAEEQKKVTKHKVAHQKNKTWIWCLLASVLAAANTKTPSPAIPICSEPCRKARNKVKHHSSGKLMESSPLIYQRFTPELPSPFTLCLKTSVLSAVSQRKTFSYVHVRKLIYPCQLHTSVSRFISNITFGIPFPTEIPTLI